MTSGQETERIYSHNPRDRTRQQVTHVMGFHSVNFQLTRPFYVWLTVMYGTDRMTDGQTMAVNAQCIMPPPYGDKKKPKELKKYFKSVVAYKSTFKIIYMQMSTAHRHINSSIQHPVQTSSKTITEILPLWSSANSVLIPQCQKFIQKFPKLDDLMVTFSLT